MQQNSQSRHSYPFGIIGNCSYLALVDTKASVKWLCWPRFDSSFIFGALLDQEEGGHFSVLPDCEKFTTHQEYIENTNILKTRFECADGKFEVIDFAPRFRLHERFHRPLMFFRKIRLLEGQPKIKVICDPRDEYGQVKPEIALGSNHLRFLNLREPMRLTTNLPLTYLKEQKSFLLTCDAYLVLSWGIPLEGPLESTFEDFYHRTTEYWRLWVERCTLPRYYQKEVIRSALTLKIHQYEDTGGIIASATTSLPEAPGAGRNWDYRFCWIRDTYYTLQALNSLSHFEEMQKYTHFIENLADDATKVLQPCYRISGELDTVETILPLKGYLGNTPVRVGNAAALQVQNDAYGQILLTLYSLYKDARLVNRLDRLPPKNVIKLLKKVESTMNTPDAGIWEFRGKTSVHAYTLLFHWAGSQAAISIGEILENNEIIELATRCVKLAEAGLEKCYSPQKEAYTQAQGSSEVDASLLQMIPLGFFNDNERAQKHLKAIQKELTIPGSPLLYRYKHEDDFGLPEVGFLVCGFWLAESEFYLKNIDEGVRIFNELLKTSNHLGLLSEDVHPENYSQWGNFPQTYSHVGLINCAFALDHATFDQPSYLSKLRKL